MVWLDPMTLESSGMGQFANVVFQIATAMGQHQQPRARHASQYLPNRAVNHFGHNFSSNC